MTTPARNDVNICVATKNGSGSASANAILFKSIFKMGIPCSAKNLFPSNIEGLPTWYFIRASQDGYQCRKDAIDVMVIFNDATELQDVHKVRAGGIVIHDDSKPLRAELRRAGVQYIGVPAGNLVREHIKQPQLREKQRNMVYVGALARLFGIPRGTIEAVLKDTFGNKPAVIESNLLAIDLGYKHIEATGATQSVAQLAELPGGNDGKIMIEGNAACALGAIFGGAAVVAWYPITPSSSLVEEMIARIEEYRVDEHGHRRYTILQAEDELASATMVVGAGWVGARSMTATAGPGLSLMQETIGLAYFAEVPGVFIVVQRGGPSTGLPTRTQQADISLMHQGSHGDTRHIVLIPHDMRSAFELTWKSFDLAERFQCPVFVAMDLDLGMNLYSSKPFEYPDKPFDRGKLLGVKELEAQGGKFRRYFDLDGDGIPQRTIPGTDHPAAAYFARGSGHDSDARYSEDAKVYKEQLDRLRRKYETARKWVPEPIVENGSRSGVGVISFGSSMESTREARDRLRAAGLPTDHLLLRALPLAPEVGTFVADHKEIYVVEQNRDGQMTQILRDEFPKHADRFRPVLVYDGVPIAAGQIVSLINSQRGT
ncbi:MAG: 2-oxoacid:acceptor oxidoreductase subunit alpha [Candidatus Lambdaproteobacteria bacterium]|nr:2-oxoacid:acceptor oxidoreductase subunit alpha [Candidatus Lambdaproteobacteria bacterium]